MMSTNVFYEMPKTEGLYENQYDVKAGRWPQNYNECVLVLTSDGGMSDFLLYTLGLRDQMELDEMIQEFINEEDVNTPANIGTYTYEDIIGKTFKLVNVSDCYEYDSQYKIWKDKSDNKEYMKKLVDQGEELKIVGIVQASEDANASALTPGIGYPQRLTEHVAKEAAKSEIVKDQLKNPSKNVFTGEPFGTTEEKNGLDADSLFTVDEDALQKALSEDVGDTYNMISVDGDTSTNDSVVLLANGMAENPEITYGTEDYKNFAEALHTINEYLAKKIAGDGEGATALFEVKAVGCESVEQAKTLAKSIVCSNLTKTAIAGHDANWGRILCAMGYSGAQFDPEKVDLFFESKAGKIQIIENGTAVDYSEAEATKILSETEVTAIADVKMGDKTATAWGCDLTHGYIEINADYRS